MARLLAFWDSLRSNYWLLPSLMACAAIALAWGMIRVDELVGLHHLDIGWVYAGGPEGAREVLSAIASSMITVAGVTFSITIVALTLASQQFGPRLLRNFLADRGNQIVLGTFVSTFTYCLLVLRTVRGNDGAEFVPHFAVTTGVALALASLGVLIFFIHHVSTSIQATSIIANVAADLAAAIDRMFPEQIGEGEEPEGSSGDPLAPPDGSPHVVSACASGYVQAIDGNQLMRIATECELVVRVDAVPGSFVRRGGALVSLWPPPQPPDRHDARLQGAFVVGRDRTGIQDLAFFVEQLVQMAVRALSPGINDPATALLCIDRLEEALAQIAGRRIPCAERADEHGSLRVIAPPQTFARLADLSLAEIGRYGATSVSVTCRLLGAIRAIAGCAQRSEDRALLARIAHAIDSAAQTSCADDRHRIERCRVAVDQALHGAAALHRDPRVRGPGQPSLPSLVGGGSSR
jgi:uncharacterized membrane protein